MRREKTMKICANFFVAPGTSIKENAGSDRSWVWQCIDFSEEKSEVSTLAIRLANSESTPPSLPRAALPLSFPPRPRRPLLCPSPLSDTVTATACSVDEATGLLAPPSLRTKPPPPSAFVPPPSTAHHVPPYSSPPVLTPTPHLPPPPTPRISCMCSSVACRA